MLSAILACVSLLSAFLKWAQTRQLLTAGEAMAVASALEKALDDVKRANEARARSDHSVDVDGVYHHDDNERSE